MSKEANREAAMWDMEDNLIQYNYMIQAQDEYEVYFRTPENPHPEKRGKWIFRTDMFDVARYVCHRGILENIVKQAKHTYDDNETLCFFYLDCDDMEGHERVIKFLRDHALPRRNKKNGKIRNISFKLDSQTRAGEYGEKFKPILRLSDFIDLDTGKWKEARPNVTGFEV